MKIASVEYDGARDAAVIYTDTGEYFKIPFADYANDKALYRPGNALEGELWEKTQRYKALLDARQAALRSLACGPRSSGALKDRLCRAGTDREIALETVLRLKKEGIINDRELCRRSAELYARKGYGPMRIRAELLKKGFTQRMTDYTLQNFEYDFENSLMRCLQNERQPDFYKLGQKYYRRGFDRQLFCRVYGELFDNDK